METQTTPFIVKLFGSAVALIGGAFGLGKYNANTVKKKELYNSDGSLIYLTAEQCRKNIEAVNKKLDGITGYLKERNERDLELMEFVGHVKQYMKDDG